MYTKDLIIGVLGGGQLGRMLFQSSLDLDLNMRFMDPDPQAPCHALTTNFVNAKLTDFDSVYNFGKDCDIITIEIENVNTEALQKLSSEGKLVYPQPNIIQLIQDKVEQKIFYRMNDIPTAHFEIVSGKDEIAGLEIDFPCVNKLAREGYDGRGVQILHSRSDIDKAFDKPGLVEEFVEFEKELSVIVARNASGEIKTFPLVEMVFHPVSNLVEFLFSPAEVNKKVESKAYQIAEKVIQSLDMVGILAVEMFLLKDGEIYVNEIAPRPHNSGHQTIEGNITSQFEQHLRAILDYPLGATDIVSPSAMVNLLGSEGYTGPAYYEGIESLLEMKGVHIHLYGKKITKPSRKMGHITLVDDNFKRLKENSNKVKQLIKVISK